MYAVFKTGGKQYRVSQGETVRVERLAGQEGAALEFDTVLMVAEGDAVKIGTPYLDGGRVTAKIKGHGRAKKIEVIKFKRRKHHDKRIGHRQSFTELQITGISAG
ncbi:MAG: 50S ribosomal protein L21 [Gammaproteobacteria bacterium]|nr:50S ribosomal protein L21 [Gammaproteobacteria bacterium]NIR98062.1 50S ribosomal protein L21 [Gammaproteobacteria bacterium]NIT63772.1 50S ribosomal protein L21 [Gammaproteobacteria bacterium]NIV20722.1 50S ribosomal protein L21 [Gammaproteobacteria bacterium]NIY32352.1 50S ribosomal protein L21 [Gammaproteobacteria bacterium]